MEEQDRAVQEAIAKARAHKRDFEPSQATDETTAGLKTKLAKMSEDLKDSREEVSAWPFVENETAASSARTNKCVALSLVTGMH
jgi:hypothetical protein